MSRYTPKQAADKLKIVNTRKWTIVAEDGITETSEQVKLLLDSTGTPKFVYLLPPYVGAALDLGDRVSASSAEEAEALLKKALHDYAAWKRNAAAELVIVARLAYCGVDESGRFKASETGYYRSSPSHSVGLEYELAYRVQSLNGGKPAIFKRKEIFGEGFPFTRSDPPSYGPGERYHPDGQVLGHTPELEAELLAIEKAIDRAAMLMARIAKSEDMAATLLTLRGGGLAALQAPEAVARAPAGDGLGDSDGPELVNCGR